MQQIFLSVRNLTPVTPPLLFLRWDSVTTGAGFSLGSLWSKPSPAPQIVGCISQATLDEIIQAAKMGSSHSVHFSEENSKTAVVVRPESNTEKINRSQTITTSFVRLTFILAEDNEYAETIQGDCIGSNDAGEDCDYNNQGEAGMPKLQYHRRPYIILLGG